MTEQSNALNPATGIPFAPVANYRYRAVEEWGPAKGNTDDIMGAVSYVTGAHNAKIGYQYRRLDLQDDDFANSTQLGYMFNRGVANAVHYYLPEMGRRTLTFTNGLYVQDTWTHQRLTVQGALRFDRASSYAPVEGNGTFGKRRSSIRRRSPSSRRRVSMPTTTLRRASARRMTCSATARRR